MIKNITLISLLVLFSNITFAQTSVPKIDDYYGTWVLSENQKDEWCQAKYEYGIKINVSKDKYILKQGNRTITVIDPVYIYHEDCTYKWWYCIKVFFIFSPNDINAKLQNDDFESGIELSDDYNNIIWGRSDGKCPMKRVEDK